VTGEFHPFLSQPINVGRGEHLLPVASEITDPEIVRQDVNNIGPLSQSGCGGEQCEGKDESSHARVQTITGASMFQCTHGRREAFEESTYEHKDEKCLSL
jgi:hypothetical protein